MVSEKTKYILGIQSYANHDSAAAIVKVPIDGGAIDYVAISEERLIREKYPYTFPLHSLAYCMDYFGLTSLDEIDTLVTDHIRVKRWFRSGPAYPADDFDYIKMKLSMDPKRIRVVGHHLAHAASAYYSSGFDEAAVLVIDGNGSDVETTSFYTGKGDDITLLDRYRFHGIGACYGHVTNWILSMGTGGEGKTMGLAPYGEKYDQVLDLRPELDGIKNDFSNFTRRLPLSDILNHATNPERLYPFKKEYRRATNAEELLEPYFSRAAFDIQKETEHVLTHLAQELFSRTNSKRLCIVGGVGLNSVSNKVILDTSGFEDVFIFPACSDAGIPFGLALWGCYNLEEYHSPTKRKLTFSNAYLGRVYDDGYVLEVLQRYDLKYSNLNLERVARTIADGRIVGWVQGRSEYGPRALGNRSIVADPRRPGMKDHINQKVKHRESFRPYAPAVLEEFVAEYFDLDRRSPYMLLIAKVKKPDVIPAVTHIDQTARIQTVNQENNGIFHDLIKEFHKITGVPVLLNTSFNDAGEPIVETPEDAIINFLSTEMDCLVVGNFVIDAIDNKHVNVVDMSRDRSELILKKRDDYLNRFCPGYDERERDYYISETNKMAEWHTKYRSLYELEKKTLEWVDTGRRVMIVGTDDHTLLLPQYVNEFMNVKIVGYIPYRKRYDTIASETPQYAELTYEDLHKCHYDEILVSSWEFQFDIMDELKKYDLDRPVYAIYDNASRSFMDVLKDRLPSFAMEKDIGSVANSDDDC